MSKTVRRNLTFELTETAYYFTRLELDHNSRITVHPSLRSVEIIVVNLVLHGRSTIDLTPPVPDPVTPPTPQGPGQVPNDIKRGGYTGPSGGRGTDGRNGVDLKLTLDNVTADDGALWIKTDGTPGGRGGDAAPGGKGSGPNVSGPNCVDAGDGGTGGTGGDGGNGGNTSKVLLIRGAGTISPTQATGFAPSSRPPSANQWGRIVISGAPGAGGQPGSGGGGGDGGEFRSCSWPRSDAKAGNRGARGAQGRPGQNGRFVP
ncbi:MAG: hypothetical protein M3410_04185 [Acidobacteriota bacterium]|nr:hypothetical protein [Acidobacteriota bacterium]